MYQLKYDLEKEALLEIDPDGKERVLVDDFPSQPQYSPNREKAIYISPLEWECPGSLYLYDLKNGEIKELIQPDQNGLIPKFAIWINHHTIAVIIGFSLGTVNIGGNVFTYNILDHKLEQVTHYSDEIQVTKLTKDDEFLLLEGIQYVDDIFNEFGQFKTKISIAE